MLFASRGSEFDAVRFTIGVPFALNHANPMLAEPPLDDSAMHWYWRSGYKFLRSGILANDRRRLRLEIAAGLPNAARSSR